MIYDIFYVSKNNINSKYWEEFSSRFPTAQKIENVKSLDDIKNKSFTKFFWVVWDDLIVLDNFDFTYRVEKWDEEYIHVWLNDCYRDGICLFPKSVSVSRKEFDRRFYLNKKEINVVASRPRPYDIIFISYNELFADENYLKLTKRFPNAKRIHGVKGIHQAHIEAAKISDTDLFWVVDADAEILDDFNFEINYIPHYDSGNRAELKNTVQVWHSLNPINELTYGYGGVKLLPKTLTIEVDTSRPDMTTSISEKFKVNQQISNITRFNTDPYSTWRSAFRECAKLSSRAINKNYDEETDNRLDIWCTIGEDKIFGKYAIGGAKAGKIFGERYIGIDEILIKINDFDWLEEQFKKWCEKNE